MNDVFKPAQALTTGYRSIVFDLAGVLFKINFIGLLRNIGVKRAVWYLLTHRKNPIDLYFKTLDALARKEKPEGKQIKYKNYLQPYCIAEWCRGLKNTQKIECIINTGIEQLDNDMFFASRQEKNIVQKIGDSLFNPQLIAHNSKPNMPVMNIVKQLRNHGNYKLFLLTNIDTETFAILKTLHPDFFNLFHGIVASCDVQMLKPEPGIYHHLLTTYDINPHHCLFIDDQQENIKAAHEAGITGIVYNRFSAFKKQLTRHGIL